LVTRAISESRGDTQVLDSVNLQIESNERICLLGRNGSGKTTLMRLLADEIEAESGEIIRPPGVAVARLEQQVPDSFLGTVWDVVASGAENVAEILTRYHHLAEEVSREPDPKLLAEFDKARQAIEAADAWQYHQRVDAICSRLGIDPEADAASLSAGLKRRVLLGKALAAQPDLLMLDEPTNHLDIESILWLEDFLLRFEGTLLFVTHDRAFLRRLATRIVELDRGKLRSWECDYDTYLKRRQDMLEAEEKQQAQFDKKLAEEEAWIRRGIKARRTRNEGRVRALQELRRQRIQRRERGGDVKLNLDEGERSGQKVIVAENLTFSYDDRLIVEGFSTRIMRGDKIGVVGPNGVGKTTLLRLLLGKLPPDAGTVKHGTNLQVAYFDQLHAQLDDEATVAQNVAPGTDKVVVAGKSRHIIGYLGDFLFPPERARSEVKYLSGGERNRLLLARLFTQPANLLVLDEPTNDLDAETLELLEETLLDYSGTLLIVSHDRAFLNNVATSTIVFEAPGEVREYVGGYDDWLRQRPAPPQESSTEAPEAKPRPKSDSPTSDDTKPRKLSYKEKQELESLPQRIEQLEVEQSEITNQVANPNFYKQDKEEIAAVTARLEAIEAELLEAFERWEILEGQRV